MTSRDESAIAEFFNLSGDLFTPLLRADWIRPESVDLLPDGRLKVRDPWLSYSARKFWHLIDRELLVKARPDLLERFLALREATDDRICEFARKHGGLRVFTPPMPNRLEGIRTLSREHLEHCDVWRYFSRAMFAVLKVAAKLDRGESVLQADWHGLGGVPRGMGQTPTRDLTGSEVYWLVTVDHCQATSLSKVAEDGKAALVALLNSLLGLGEVRPWVTWPGSTRSHARLQVAYSGRSLLSNLALQLCLRISRIDAFLVCVHCQAQYIPRVRAPKAGQRNFCAACRKAGVPKKYALKDFRDRQRRSQNA